MIGWWNSSAHEILSFICLVYLYMQLKINDSFLSTDQHDQENNDRQKSVNLKI